MAKTGRKSKYESFKDNKGLILVEGWARDGLSDVQIAKNLGISLSTFYKWKKDFSEFSESIKRSKEIADYEVENALFKKAKMGDVTAQIFWLKNRRPDKWRDKADINANVDSNGVLDSILELRKDVKGNMEQ